MKRDVYKKEENKDALFVDKEIHAQANKNAIIQKINMGYSIPV